VSQRSKGSGSHGAKAGKVARRRCLSCGRKCLVSAMWAPPWSPGDLLCAGCKVKHYPNEAQDFVHPSPYPRRT
jgi:hypothetical protein